MVAVPAPEPTNYQNARRRTAGIIRDSGSAVPDIAETSATGPRPRPDGLAFLKYPSGSTGEPKGVMVTNGNIKARLTEVFAIPARNVVLVRRGSVQRTTSGKIERIATRRLFLAGTLRVVHTDIESAVARLVRVPELAGADPVAVGGAVVIGGTR